MSTWTIIIILALAAAGILYALYQRKQTQTSGRLELGQGQSVNADYPRDREEARLAHLSEDDRAWETAALQRHLENQKVRQAVAEQPL